MEDLFGFCPNCTQTDFLFPSPQKRKGMPPLNLCKECLDKLKAEILVSGASETRYHEMAENLNEREE